MSIKLNDSIRVEGGKPVEDKRLNNGMPWESVEQVNASIPITDRYLSLEVLIGDTLYWYKDSTEDYGLVVRDELNIHDLDVFTNQKIEQAVSDLKIGGRNHVLKSRITMGTPNIMAGGTKSEVTDSSFGKVVRYDRPNGGGEFQFYFNVVNRPYLNNKDLIYMVIAKPLDSGDNSFSFGLWSFSYYAVNQDSNKKDLGNDWFCYWAKVNLPDVGQGGLLGINTVKGSWLFYAVGIFESDNYVDWSPAPEDIFDDINTRVLKTSVNINTSQAISYYSQHGRNIVTTGTANLVVTVDSEDGFCATYQKGGAGSITFQAGAGKTLVQVDGTNIVNGVKGSTATVTVVGNEVLLRIANG